MESAGVVVDAAPKTIVGTLSTPLVAELWMLLDAASTVGESVGVIIDVVSEAVIETLSALVAEG